MRSSARPARPFRGSGYGMRGVHTLPPPSMLTAANIPTRNSYGNSAFQPNLAWACFRMDLWVDVADSPVEHEAGKLWSANSPSARRTPERNPARGHRRPPYGRGIDNREQFRRCALSPGLAAALRHNTRVATGSSPQQRLHTAGKVHPHVRRSDRTA